MDGLHAFIHTYIRFKESEGEKTYIYICLRSFDLDNISSLT